MTRRTRIQDAFSPAVPHIVGKDDAVGRVDVEWLRLCVVGRACRWVSNVADAHWSTQTSEAVCVKDVSYHAVCLALVEATSRSTRHDAGSILAAMLKKREGLVDLWCSRS